MEVYCTRPRQPDEAPHWTEIPIDNLSGYHQCSICEMPLILANRYVPVEELGRGGFGCTFRALDLRFKTEDGCYSDRTIKQFRAEQLLLPSQIERAHNAFTRECNMLDKLDHQQIPRVYEPFEVEIPIDLGSSILEHPKTYYYFVQKYIQGRSLQDRLFTEIEILDFIDRMLPVLEYIHTRSIPILHLDIKPSNIIQSDDGTYHLIDFGAFKQFISKTTLSSSQAETNFVTPRFSPQEQYHGRVDFSSDIYALGKTCLCLLAGNSSQPATIESPHLSKILNKMTEDNPQQRYRSVMEIQTELDPPQTPITSQTADTPHRIEQSIPWLKIIIIGICLAIVSIGVNQILKVIFPPLAVFDPPKIDNISSVQNVPAGTFSYGGSTTWTPLSQSINPIIQQSFRTLQLRYQPPHDGTSAHSDDGIEMLIQGRVDIALSSKPISARLQKGVDNVRLLNTIIAKSSTAVVVNPSLKIDGLTTAELGLIKEGKITNWQEVRGPNLPIVFYMRDKGYLSGAKFERVPNSTATFQKVAEDPGGLTISPSNIAALQCTVKVLPIGINLNSLVSPYIQPLVSKSECIKGYKDRINIDVIRNLNYPLVSDLRVFIRGDDALKHKIGEAYITMLMTKEGQRRIKDAGYLPMRE
jgi:serine/threonine protein kinase